MDTSDKDQQEIIQIANEFTTIHVRKVFTRNGERLEIESKKYGFKVQLDTMQLEILTMQKPDIYSKLLEQALNEE